MEELCNIDTELRVVKTGGKASAPEWKVIWYRLEGETERRSSENKPARKGQIKTVTPPLFSLHLLQLNVALLKDSYLARFCAITMFIFLLVKNFSGPLYNYFVISISTPELELLWINDGYNTIISVVLDWFDFWTQVLVLIIL